MKAIYLVKNGPADKAYEWREIEEKDPQPDEVAIKTEAAGLNFADVVARLGQYQDAPPLPFISGYEVVGRIVKIGSSVKDLKIGQRVLAFTRFGGYSEYVCQKALAVSPIPEDMPTGEALALATQYCTAYYASHIATNVFPGDKVLIQAAAGGVGIALTQLCKLRGAYIYGTAGSDEKLDFIRSQGVDVAINYRKNDFSKVIKEPIDVAFDSVGGEDFRKCYKLLNRAGRLVGFGVSTFTDANIFQKAKQGLAFGIYHPAQLLLESRTMVGVNLLRVADYRQDLLEFAMKEVVRMTAEGKLHPHVGGMYDAKDLAKAQEDLEKRRTIGKIGIVF